MPLLRSLNKELVVVGSRVFTRTGTDGKGAKISIEIIWTSHHCDLCDFAGMHDFG